jgi:hypothetical protein
VKIVIGIVGLVIMVLISRAIPNSARSGGSSYSPLNLLACLLIGGVAIAAALAVMAGA